MSGKNRFAKWLSVLVLVVIATLLYLSGRDGAYGLAHDPDAVDGVIATGDGKLETESEEKVATRSVENDAESIDTTEPVNEAEPVPKR